MTRILWMSFGIIAAIIIACAIGVAILPFVPSAQGVTYANFSRIEEGMSRVEVIALLGATERETKLMCYWKSESGDEVAVQFDEKDKVELAAWNNQLDERNRFERIRDRVHWFAHQPPQKPLPIPGNESPFFIW